MSFISTASDTLDRLWGGSVLNRAHNYARLAMYGGVIANIAGQFQANSSLLSSSTTAILAVIGGTAAGKFAEVRENLVSPQHHPETFEQLGTECDVASRTGAVLGMLTISFVLAGATAIHTCVEGINNLNEVQKKASISATQRADILEAPVVEVSPK